MKRMSLRLWLTSSQRRKLEISIYVILLVIGFMAGMFFTMKHDNMSIFKFCITYGMAKSTVSRTEVFLFCFLKNGVPWLLSIFFGLCAIGQPCLLSILLMHGFASGCCLAYLSSDFNAVIFPRYMTEAVFTIASSFIILLAVRSAVRFSLAAIEVYISESSAEGMRKNLKLYFVRFGILFLMVLLLSGIYAVLIGFF